MLGTEGEPTAWTVGGAKRKPAKFGGGGGGGGGIGTYSIGEPELRVLVAEGEPTVFKQVGGTSMWYFKCHTPEQAADLPRMGFSREFLT